MSELLVPADGEVAAIAEFADAATHHPRWGSVRAGTRIPSVDNLPSRFVRVVAAGGGVRELVTDEHTLVVEAFAIDEGDARDLCAFVVAALERAARDGELGGVPCYVLSAGTPASNPHPDVPTHFRYSVTAVAALRRALA